MRAALIAGPLRRSPALLDALPTPHCPSLARGLSNPAAPHDVWATSITLAGGKTLEVEFNTGERFTYPAEYLRVESPAAEARDAAGHPKLVSGRRHVGILSVEPVGSYAVKLDFDDMHRAGIYTWPYLYTLGAHKLSRMKEYVRHLRSRGLSRDPPALRRHATQRQQHAGEAGGGSAGSAGSKGSSSGGGGGPG